MARKVVYVDDLDGTEIAEGEGGPVFFGLDDKRYQLDLSAKSRAKLEKALAPFIDKAAEVEEEPAAPVRTRGTAKRAASSSPGRGGSGLSKDELEAARQWLRKQGHEVSDRGRIKGELLELYLSAHKR